MNKSEIIQEIKKQKIVAVIRGEDFETGLQTCIACIDSGLTAIEMAYSNNYASEIIKVLNNKYKDDSKVIIGAGTVLDAATARLAILAGAKFIVSPSFDEETALLCNTYCIPYIPGCMTIKEVLTGMKYGSEIVKIFPGNTLGKGFLSAIRGPLPYATLMVTGGVNKDNMQEWFEAGADSLGIGGELNKLAAIGDFETLKKNAAEYVRLARGE